jgi:hypothetical protein
MNCLFISFVLAILTYKGVLNLKCSPCVVALDSALGFIKSLPIEERPLNQCHLLDQSIGDL